MGLKMILGPMKSGKSFDMISCFMPLQYSNISFEIYQPQKNVRDKALCSRNGIELKAKKIATLSEVSKNDFSIIGIDEIHMFDSTDVFVLEKMLKRNNLQIIIAGLDLDYRGELFPIVKNLFEIGPDKVVYKKAVCENCKQFSAKYTQILTQEGPILDSLPSVVPDDGTYIYKSLCRKCFVKK